MNQGMDPTGVELNAKTNFFSGAALNPNMRPIEPEVLKLKRKMDAGAKFFQTQAVFEASVMEKFLLNAEKLVGDIRPKIVVGIIPLASERMIQFLNRLPGIRVPTDVSHRVIHSKDPAAEGIAVAVETIDKIKGFGLGGAHIMPVGRMAALNQIVKKTAVP
jgi:5,10-methylenetetrahydrofolate reductase